MRTVRNNNKYVAGPGRPGWRCPAARRTGPAVLPSQSAGCLSEHGRTRGTSSRRHRMQRDIFASEHEDFRDLVRAFIAKEVTPYHEKWEADKMVSRDVWLAAGRAGLLGIEIDEKYGG